MTKQRYTAEQVAEALRAAGGVNADAAQRLGCHRTTVMDYMRRYPQVREVYEDARAVVVDMAESQLKALVEKGVWPAIRFVLVTLGRDRGYSDKRTPTERFMDSGQEDDNAFREAITMVYGPRAEGVADSSKPEQSGDEGADEDEPEG